MSMTFLQLAEKVLEQTKRPLTNTEIWNYAEANDLVPLLESQGKTPQATMSARLSVDIRDNPKSKFFGTGYRPRKYALKSNTPIPSLPVESAPENPNIKYLESDLHPVLAYYTSIFLNLYVKTINHSRSEKKSFGEWVHPDIVGCYFPFTEWRSEVVDISTITGSAAIKLYSFELKRELSFGNLRESFFQAVSNSSWANEGYLVAAKISDEGDFLDELKRLNASFGIGVIKLDIDDPDASQILFPAHQNDQIDWETVNKLSGMNSDFEKLLVRIKKDYSTREIRREQYDKVLLKEEIIKKFVQFQS